MAIDVKHHRLFLGCDNHLMVMMDSANGKVWRPCPLAKAWMRTRLIPARSSPLPRAATATVTIAHEDGDKLTVVQTLKTERGARTMTLDPKTHKIYLAAAQFEPPRGTSRQRTPSAAQNGSRHVQNPGVRDGEITGSIVHLAAGLDGPGSLPQSRRMRVLVVEDEKKTASFVRKALQAEGFAVDVCHNGDDALAAARATPFDGIVLDIMLPGRDGLSVLRQLRERKNTTPVLLLSARGEVNERIEGLDAGADDYLPKPFELAELVARVRALTRRSGENKSTVLRVADLTLDTITHRAQRGGTDIELTAREYRLLEFLMRDAGRICGRMTIIEKVWDYDFDPGTNLVDVYIRRLREKIDANFEPKLLHTVRGTGYVLKDQT